MSVAAFGAHIHLPSPPAFGRAHIRTYTHNGTTHTHTHTHAKTPHTQHTHTLMLQIKLGRPFSNASLLFVI